MRAIQLKKAEWNIDETHPLGQGGCGDVFIGSAVDGAPVAIKLLRGLGDDARELDVAAFFCSHPTKHLVPVLDYGVDAHSNRPCVVMKLADYSLRAKLTDVSQFGEADAVGILVDLCLGLIEATSWVHRDLKPENCLFLDGRWQLADFGCARQADAATATMTVRNVMTLPYAAPEQIYGLHATHATDVYALGCIGAELLSGQFAFAAPNFLREHLHGTPTILNASAKMHTLLLRMMAREGDVRPTIRAVLDELEAFKTPRTPAGRGSTRLLESYARYNNTMARAEAERIDTETKRQFRQDIAQTAVHELKTVGERLMDAVDVIAPGARQKLKEQTPPPQPPAHPSYPRQVQGQRQGATTPAVTELRHAIFYANLHQGTLVLAWNMFPDSEELFAPAGWNVYAGGLVAVWQSNHVRSASLWFASVQGAKPSWYEVGYFSPTFQGFFPTALKLQREASDAFTNNQGSWRLAYPPRKIDEDTVDAFCERWLELFGIASEHELLQPDKMPDGNL